MSVSSFSLAACLALAMVGVSASGVAQASPQALVIQTLCGAAAADDFGAAVAVAGDVDADGVADFIVGAPGEDANGSGSGAARVYSGADGSLLFVFLGADAGDALGAAVAGAGDVDGDGHDDVIVGAYLDEMNGPSSGSAFVWSGLDGSLLHTFVGDDPHDYFGFAVSGVGDVDGDGRGDVVVGAFNDDDGGPNAGSARVFSGASGAILFTFHGDGAFDWFGSAVAGAGDVDGDGRPDVLVGAFREDDNGVDSGSARVFSGATGQLLLALFGDHPGDSFGAAVASAGDVDGDGRADVAIGAHLASNAAFQAGAVSVVSGATGALLFRIDGEAAGDRFGFALAGGRDVDGDGVPDLAVGARTSDAGERDAGLAVLVSGADGSVLHRYVGISVGDQLGNAIAFTDDADGDGHPDVLIGVRHGDGAAVAAGCALRVSTHPPLRVPRGFATIQAALTAASTGDVILVEPGTWTENVDFLGRDVVVRSRGGALVTTIDGGGAGPVATFASGEGPAARLEGFTLTNGFGPSGGGGVRIVGASPTVVACRIVQNTTASGARGGGVLVAGGNPTLRGCLIARNDAGRGTAPAPDGGAGGGVFCAGGAPSLSFCRIADNVAAGRGGGLHQTLGQTALDGCVIAGNRAAAGGGLSYSGGTWSVGGSTIAGNVAGVGAGVLTTSGLGTLVNTIVWDNAPDAIRGAAAAHHCLIEGGFPGVGNLDVDPLFLDPVGGDYHLSATSPAVDAGDVGAVTGATDVDRDPRVFYGGVDIGADEYVSSCFAGAVGIGAGGPFGVLQINDGAGPRVDVGLNRTILFQMAHPPGNPAPAAFLIVGYLGAPTPGLETPLPLGLGAFCFPPAAAVPGVFVLTSSFAPLPGELVPSGPTPWSLGTAVGLPFPFVATFQGLILADPFTVRVTNAVILRVG